MPVLCYVLPVYGQDELVAEGYMKAAPDAALADKMAAQARKAASKARANGKSKGTASRPGTGADPLTGFRRFTSPGELPGTWLQLLL